MDPTPLPRAPLSLSNWLTRPQGAIPESQAPEPGAGLGYSEQVSRFADEGIDKINRRLRSIILSRYYYYIRVLAYSGIEAYKSIDPLGNYLFEFSVRLRT